MTTILGNILLGAALSVGAVGCCTNNAAMPSGKDVALEGVYPGHLQDFWIADGTIWWAHTEWLVKTDLTGHILEKAEVGAHHAGLEIKDGHLYTAVCAHLHEPRGATTKESHVAIGEYDANTLKLIEMHILPINDRAGSFCFLEDGTMLVGCLRHPSLKPTEVKFHHLDRNYNLIKTHVIDIGKKVKMGIEVIRRRGNDVYLFIYGGPVMKLDAKTLEVTGRYQSFGGQMGIAFDGDHAWIGKSINKEPKGAPKQYRSHLTRVPAVWK